MTDLPYRDGWHACAWCSIAYTTPDRLSCDWCRDLIESTFYALHRRCCEAIDAGDIRTAKILARAASMALPNLEATR